MGFHSESFTKAHSHFSKLCEILEVSSYKYYFADSDVIKEYVEQLKMDRNNWVE